MKSSYLIRSYGLLFQALIRIAEPKCCVECGVFDGYSSIIIGNALKSIGTGHLYSYDIFEDYPYTHSQFEDVNKRIEKFELDDVITIIKKDIFDAVNDFDDQSIGLLHIDISNTGEIINKAMTSWNPKIIPGGLLIFEGGSPLRDEVEWMKRYGKNKIFPEISSNPILNEQYTSIVLHHYPSMAICSKNVTVNDQTWNEFGYDSFSKGMVHKDLSDDELLKKMIESS